MKPNTKILRLDDCRDYNWQDVAVKQFKEAAKIVIHPACKLTTKGVMIKSRELVP